MNMTDLNGTIARLLRLAAAITDQVGEATYNLTANIGEVLKIYAREFNTAQERVDAKTGENP